MERNFKNFFGLIGEKATQTSTVTAFEATREGQPKAYIPNFFYKPPFGYPRYKDLLYYRKLAASVYVDMVETAIIDEVCSFDHVIVAEDREGNEVPGKEKEVEIIDSFFQNPNTRMMLPDLLEINSGILVKVFNSFGKMVEIVARNGSAFTKNPDVYGMFTNRADLILMKNIYDKDSPYQAEAGYPLLNGYLTSDQAREEAAYFQYGFNTGAKPVPFGKREIVWIEKKVRTDDIYGRSSMEVLAKTVQTLIYSVEHNLEYFSDNSIPPGVLGLDGMSSGDMKAFAQQWTESQKKSDALGTWKKAFHKLAMVNKMPKFERMGFTNQELELIESQKWWSKLVWASFGVTATELGFTEDAKGSGNQIVQTSAVRRKIIYPILHLLEYYINTQIIPEFGFEGVRFKYKIQDIDEETKKWSLYKLQTESNLKTINEIRNTEGLDALEGGDETGSMQADRQQTADRETNDPLRREENQINQDSQDTRDKLRGDSVKKKNNPEADAETEKIKLNKVKSENMQRHKFKPAKWTHPNGHPRCILCGQEERIGGYCDARTEEKALNTDSSLILQPNERMSPDKLKKVIIDLLRLNKKKIINILETQKKKDPVMQIKSIDDIPKMIKQIFSIFSLKQVSDQVIKSEFDSGWDSSEKKLNRNVQYNQNALEFLQEHTFDNIKSMTEEIANDLKAELERGIINGEGIGKLTKRVDKVFDVGENRAEMIARTETNRADNNGKLLAMKESGLEMQKKWVTHEDDRTSPICNRLDGQVVGVDNDFEDSVSGWTGQAPPSHVNCRSTIIFQIKEEKEE